MVTQRKSPALLECLSLDFITLKSSRGAARDQRPQWILGADELGRCRYAPGNADVHGENCENSLDILFL